MSLTPEQWKGLDEAERMVAAARAAALGGSHSAMLDYREARCAMLDLLADTLRSLIDAARPKCEQCEGVGKLSGKFAKRDGSVVQGWTCPGCGGTGWAGTSEYQGPTRGRRG